MAEAHQRNPHRRACCLPFAGKKRERLGFLAGGRRRKQRKLWPMRKLLCRWGLFIAQSEEDESAAGAGTAFTPGFNWGERVDKKTEGESADSDCVDGKVKDEGQIRDFRSPSARKARRQ